MSPGFLLVTGDEGWGDDGAGPMVRLYWNLGHQAAARFLRLLPAALDRAGVAFAAKVLLRITDYALRRDTGVVYLAATDFPRAAAVLRGTAGRLGPDLRRGVPAFAKELIPGVGVAECPPGQGSFGQVRCRVLAEALVEVHRTRPHASADARLAAVVAHLEASGLRLDALHRNPGSTADYVVPALPPPRRRSPARARRSTVTPPSVVESVSRRLCDEAIWYRGRCNWVGPVRNESDPTAPATAFGALGPDVYDGTSGIALFLAEAATVLDDETMRRTAVGAARQAAGVVAAQDPSTDRPAGFYCGSTGAAFVAARVGRLSGCGELLEAAARAADRGGPAARSGVADLVAGHAGRVVGLLALAGTLGDTDLVAAAARAGDALIDRAVRSARGGWSWPSPAPPRSSGLTGLSHGAAGIAYALVELYAATGDSRYRDAALQAFAYENRWFSPADQNWLDLRYAGARRSTAPRVFRRGWCHGAPGIALSRVRAHEVLDEAELLADARAGLTTTLHAVRADLAEGSDDFSLCHGTAGLADVLLLGLQAVGERAQDVRRVVESAVEAASPNVTGERPWPCAGQAGGGGPGLLLGAAGIGYLHLRLLRDDLPSVLLPGSFVDLGPR